MDYPTVQITITDGSNSIFVSNEQSQTNGMPDKNLQLTFPQLDRIKISGSASYSVVADLTLSLFDQLPTCCPLIYDIEFEGDPTLKNFPNGFGSISTTLQRCAIYFVGKQSIKFPSHPTVSELQLLGDETTTEFIIEDTVLLPDLMTLGFGLSSGNALQSIGNITEKSFPVLTIINSQGSTALVMIGSTISFDPSLDKLTRLKTITGNDYASTQYPFSQAYPPNIVNVNYRTALFTTIPPVTLPSTAANLDISDNLIELPIDFNTILKNSTGNLILNLQNNDKLVGPLDQETALCRLKTLNLAGTGVTSLPDCFWCYQNEPIFRLGAPIPIPIPFTCSITFDDTNLATVFGKTIIKGKNLGWGANVGGNTLVAIVPNEQLQATLSGLVTDSPPQPIDIQFSNDYPEYKYQFKVVEAGFTVSTTTSSQQPNHLTIVTVTFLTVNTYLSHTASINGVLATTISNVGITYQFGFTNQLSTGTYNVNISNDYYSFIVPNVQYTQSYPIVDNFISDAIVKSGSTIQLEGNFGTYLVSSSVTIQNSNSQYNYSVCSITEFTTTRISCKVESPISSGLATFNITVDGYSILKQYTIQSAQQQCESETNHCANNGACTPDGICVCNINQGGYYNNCSKQSTQFTIQCQLESSPTIYGPASVQLNVDGLLFDSKTYLIRFIKPSTGGSTTSSTTSVPTTSTSTTGGETPKTPKEICSDTTQYCFGHGTCDDNGICQCQSGFNPVDNCLTKFADNTTYIPNPESPSTNISVDGVEFGFDIVAIQEIGLDNEIVKELLTNSWLSNITTNSTFTDAVYQLVISNTSILADTQVTVNITFSTQSRSITFGNQQLLINPNSIKLAVSINGWEYSSNVATLRVVLKTTTNNQQSIEYDCKETDISSFSYDDYGTLQYLRVLKDNVQFNGRFIDFALADGRKTYSQTLLINQTSISDEESVSMIGITLPQCQSCVLDPDFTPLLVVNDKDGHCSSTDQKWKIIVGCVVGGIGLVAIAVGSVIYYRKNMRTKRYDAKMAAKLKSFS
ncbi:hypothetical protein DFA_05159 [Cavenderia fasciculata]|uniref:EGF-like domain-containing protein n=1 Tax=Cavenderia fasciculata TaxID=261658 RepID=F4PNH6_CACFS|nr:uncharacterized protein DFA_05159 [Cavenderia fasciculata]EGG23029.1 hypothetical protein DFA_05159 [Cavenderia fasciculata]|eukprot:XP_004360880.1 hypothetical protein DFA_05159 [Cavenderia fasciculata]